MGSSGDAERKGPSPAAEPDAVEETLEDLERWALAHGMDPQATTAVSTPNSSTIAQWEAEIAALDNPAPTDALHGSQPALG